MDNVASLGIILGLIFLNGLFVAAEFAMIGVPRAAIEAKAEAGHRIARLVRGILKDPRLQDQYIATAQLGITLASLGLGMYGEHVLALWLATLLAGLELAPAAVHALAGVLAIAILTYFHIVLGEMIPKSLALQKAEKTALWVAPWMLWTRRLTFPLILLLNGLGNQLLKIVGIDRQLDAQKGYRSSEELQYLVKESEKGGQLTPEAGKLLQEIFDFDQLLAREVLVPRVKVTGIPLGAGSDQLSRIYREKTHTRYPVYDETIDRIIGMLHVQDIFARLMDGKPVVRTEVRKVPFLPESASLNQVLAAMREKRTQLCVILDEYGGTEGIITLNDLFREVVGKIHEGVPGQGDVYFDKRGRLIVAGGVRVEELGQSLNLRLEHSEVDSVSGLVLALLGRPPEVGESVEFDGLRLEVIEKDGLGLKWCSVTRIGLERAGESEKMGGIPDE